MARGVAHILSFVFHPLLMVTYGLLFLMWANPYEFGGIGLKDHAPILILQVFMLTFILPVFSVIMMKMLEMVDDIQLSNKQDRTIPYITTAVFYCWLSVNLHYNQVYPKMFEIFAIGSTLALFIAFFVNIFSKISLHTVGMGGLIGLIITTMLFYSYDNLEFALMAAIIVAGLVGTARLLLEAHESMDVYGGYLVGFSAQLIVFAILY